MCGIPSSAFTENDLYIAREAVNAKIPVIAVRNKANQALESRRRRSPVSEDITSVM